VLAPETWMSTPSTNSMSRPVVRIVLQLAPKSLDERQRPDQAHHCPMQGPEWKDDDTISWRATPYRAPLAAWPRISSALQFS